MATVLRVKRHCDEDPLEALVFACKKRKRSEGDTKERDSSFAAVVKFTATVKEQENDLSLFIPVNEKEDIWKTRLNHKIDISKKLREERKQFSENNRFKVVNCFRHIDADGSGGDGCDDAQKKDIIVYDIESSKQTDSEDPEKVTSEEDSQYVYDIYYGQTNNEYDFASLDHIVDIMPVSSFDFGTRDGTSDNDSVVADDDDDSNDENNWRNDYPDSDHSINEDDMRLAMQMGDMNLGNELSSSDEELVYGVESDPQDVEYYGEVYAKYKARIRREEDDISSDDENDSADENSEFGSGDEETEDPILRYM